MYLRLRLVACDSKLKNMHLSIQKLNKTYPNGVHALKDVTLDIPTGMFGLLGPNGAGKSSLMRTIATLQEADSGSITLGDIDVLRQKEAVRKVLGYLPQEFGLYPRVNAEMLLDHFARLKGITNNSERSQVVKTLLQRTNLWDHRKKNLGGYSGGMKQRFGIAQALLGNPKLIIVDEPTAGLDPTERNRFHNLLSEISENVIVILSTHIIDDVHSLCSQLAIISTGEVRMTGTPLETVAKYRGRVWKKLIEKHDLHQYDANQLVSNRLVAGKMEITSVSDFNPDGTFEPTEPTLEDVYFTVVGNSLVGA
ncbi:MAG: transporter ATP-binding protein [Bacteroidetes bacterium]|nr:transporter ATP-binding protein [Bacteroidota bacterium]